MQIDLSVVRALQVELSTSLEPRQGVLYGRTAPGGIEIVEWQPVAGLERETFAASLAKETRNVLGFYAIREGSAFILSPAEVALAQEMFKKPGSVVLLVERRKKGPAEATFYFWRGDVFVHNLPLPFPFHAGILAGETPGLREIPAEAPRPFTPPTPVRRKAMLIGLYAASALAAGGIVATHLRQQSETATLRLDPADMTPPADATWISTEPKRDLELTWDARAEMVSNATAGVLKIEDAGMTRQMSLDVGELLMGSILYAPASDRIRVELTTLQRDGKLAPVPIAAQPAAPSASTQVAAQPPAPAASPGQKTSEPATAAQPPLKKAEVVEQAAATPRPPLKRFTWTAADRAAPPPTPILDAPHQALPVVNPAVLTSEVAPSALGVPTLPAPPPPKPAPAPAPTAPARVIPKFGRLIWTGTVQRKGVIELDGRSVSVGSLNGALPGVPVNVWVTPAEFGADGLMVYTTDAARHNRVEPPSAGNGWNKVTYVWAPERVREISILEAPNPSNGFSRLAVRSDARRCSMLLIDWSLR